MLIRKWQQTSSLLNVFLDKGRLDTLVGLLWNATTVRCVYYVRNEGWGWGGGGAMGSGEGGEVGVEVAISDSTENRYPYRKEYECILMVFFVIKSSTYWSFHGNRDSAHKYQPYRPFITLYKVSSMFMLTMWSLLEK